MKILLFFCLIPVFYYGLSFLYKKKIVNTNLGQKYKDMILFLFILIICILCLIFLVIVFYATDIIPWIFIGFILQLSFINRSIICFLLFAGCVLILCFDSICILPSYFQFRFQPQSDI